LLTPIESVTEALQERDDAEPEPVRPLGSVHAPEPPTGIGIPSDADPRDARWKERMRNLPNDARIVRAYHFQEAADSLL
jgi:hypothetical protein